MATPQITVEFFGIPRQRAGRAELTVPALTVRDALREVTRVCPRLGDLLQSDNRLSSHYLLSLGGEAFVTDLDRPVNDGDRLLLLSADAGG